MCAPASPCATENHSIFSMKYYYVDEDNECHANWLTINMEKYSLCAPGDCVCVCAHRPLLKMYSTNKKMEKTELYSVVSRRAFTRSKWKICMKRRYALLHTTLTNAFIEREIFLRRTVSLRVYNFTLHQEVQHAIEPKTQQPTSGGPQCLCTAARQRKKNEITYF